uniref:Uncharacterized protein n=1 Tax=Steinernema glaseri TaxID=37863 RepID=A0A1I8A2R5_9BILA
MKGATIKEPGEGEGCGRQILVKANSLCFFLIDGARLMLGVSMAEADVVDDSNGHLDDTFLLCLDTDRGQDGARSGARCTYGDVKTYFIWYRPSGVLPAFEDSTLFSVHFFLCNFVRGLMGTPEQEQHQWEKAKEEKP